MIPIFVGLPGLAELLIVLILVLPLAILYGLYKLGQRVGVIE